MLKQTAQNRYYSRQSRFSKPANLDALLFKLKNMTCITRKYYPSKYKYVQNLKTDGKDYWCINMVGISKTRFKTEREAAIAVDKLLIKKGKEPVNILVRK